MQIELISEVNNRYTIVLVPHARSSEVHNATSFMRMIIKLYDTHKKSFVYNDILRSDYICAYRDIDDDTIKYTETLLDFKNRSISEGEDWVQSVTAKALLDKEIEKALEEIYEEI